MARGTRLLRILVHPTLYDLESIQALRDKGHTVESMTSTSPSAVLVSEYDLVLGPNCWRMTTTLAKHVNLAVKSSRMEKYGAPTRKKGASHDPVDANPDLA